MTIKLIFVLSIAISSLASNSQYSAKRFKNGYVIRNEDTLKCKVFKGLSVNQYERLVFKYSDNRSDEPIEYFPGSIVKGYGIKTDSGYTHFWAFPVSTKTLFKKTQKVVYGKVEGGGYLKLLEYVEIGGSSGSFGPNRTYRSGPPAAHVSYYLYKTDDDSAYNIRGEHPYLLDKIDEEGLINYFSDYPELTSKMKGKSRFKLDDVIEFVKEYNAWYEETKKKK